MKYTGEIAALTTAVLWSFTSIFFTSASRRIGSYHLNKFRIPFAAVFLAAMLLITSGRLLPGGISGQSYMYLIISGIIGLSIGDLCLFSAFVSIGTRLTLLVFSVSPIITAIIAWFMIGETLGFYPIIGIAVTISGIAWVTAERQPANNGSIKSDRKMGFGILMAVCGAAGQAIGLVLAKAGMAGTLEPLPATFIRMISATAAIWLIGIFRRDNMQTIKKAKDHRAMLLALGGSICGPFLGVWLSLVAVKYTATGIAAAIMATVPVLVIPLVIIVYKERVTARAILGAVITTAGVALLFLS
ncbi:MAG: DMT family transporter [Candidatus Zixiibacteriota bacterium]